jgi:uncharacterized RDD family membrane protein YckC
VRDLYVIKTPENVVFEFELAGISARALAWGIDLFVMVVLIVAAILVTSMFAVVAGGFAIALLSIAVFLVQWWYSALFEWWWGGQTIGKRVVGLRTISASGVRVSFLQAVTRNLVRNVDILPAIYGVGGVTALLDRHGRRLGDLAAGTIVVRERRVPKPSTVVPPSERYNTFVNDPEVAVAARRITPPERDAMIALGLSREELPLAIRHELFTELAAHLEARLGVPRPPYFSEEKYVLNLTAVVLGQAEGRKSLPPGLRK